MKQFVEDKGDKVGEPKQFSVSITPIHFSENREGVASTVSGAYPWFDLDYDEQVPKDHRLDCFDRHEGDWSDGDFLSTVIGVSSGFEHAKAADESVDVSEPDEFKPVGDYLLSENLSS